MKNQALYSSKDKSKKIKCRLLQFVFWRMKNQALYSSKDKSKKIKCRLLQFVFGALRVKWMKSFGKKGLFDLVNLCTLNLRYVKGKCPFVM